MDENIVIIRDMSIKTGIKLGIGIVIGMSIAKAVDRAVGHTFVINRREP